MKHTYLPRGTCSRKIEFEIENGIVKGLRFTGGCNGNTSGLSHLIEGMEANAVIARLKGIRCGMRPTSCPDQLALALEAALEQETKTQPQRDSR